MFVHHAPRSVAIIWILAVLLAPALPAQTYVQISLAPSSVVGGGSTWDSTSFDGSATFSSSNVLNQQSGSVAETTGTGTPDGSFWLGPENSDYAYFVIDLGAAYEISRIDLFNTHNQGYFDRGTNGFTISVSNSVENAGEDAGLALTDSVSLLTASLPQGLVDPITGLTYTSANGLVADATAYRYLQFTTNSRHGSGTGLAEIRVYTSAIPEPSTYAAMAGALALGVAAWRRRRRV